MNKQVRVFVTQETLHSLAGAETYGRLVFLLPRGSVYQPAVRTMRAKLRGYDGQRDYILTVGDPAAIGLAVALAAAEGNGYVRLLRYDARAARYYAVDLDLYDRVPEAVTEFGDTA